MNEILKIDNLSVSYGSKKALQDISLTVNKGDFIGLLGSNGAGKSTLINSITGLQKNVSGSILFNTEAFNTELQPFACLGFTPQTSVMDYYTTVWDNVMLGLNLAGKRGEEAVTLCNSALEIVGLSDKANELVESLSGGQLQRVQIARAIAHKPYIYILDEPTVGLDAESSERFLSYLKGESERGKTIIISSHDIQLLEMFCEKILFLQSGKLLFWGNLEDFIGKTAQVIEFTVKNKISDSKLIWLKSFNFQIEILNSKSFKVHFSNNEDTILIIQKILKEFDIKDIKIKDKQLRESYLNRVREEVYD